MKHRPRKLTGTGWRARRWSTLRIRRLTTVNQPSSSGADCKGDRREAAGFSTILGEESPWGVAEGAKVDVLADAPANAVKSTSLKDNRGAMSTDFPVGGVSLLHHWARHLPAGEVEWGWPPGLG